MAFADWKKRTTAFERYLPRGYHAMAELVAHAAYKAGERDGRKQAEAVAEQAIKLRELMRSNAGNNAPPVRAVAVEGTVRHGG